MIDQKNRRIAAIDIGSNSIHLTVAEVSHERISILVKEKVNARLGLSLDTRSYLSGTAIRDAVETLAHFRDICKGFHAEVRVCATAALRKAKNRAEFVQAASEEDVSVVIVDDLHEARLVRAGALFGLPNLFNTRVLCVDVGGGSTELSVGRAGTLTAVTSLPVGGLTIQRRLGPDPISRNRLRIERTNLLRSLQRSVHAFRYIPYECVVATGGTIQRLARIISAFEDRPESEVDGAVLNIHSIRQVLRRLSRCGSHAERIRIPGIDRDRVDVLLGGILIFDVLSQALKIDEWVVSKNAMRAGVLIAPSWQT